MFNRETLERVDEKIITSMRHIYLPFSRLAIFLIFFWFGLLKVTGESPASPLVLSLLDRTLPFMNPGLFVIGFGVFEMIIGAFFLIPRIERLAIAILFAHLITTAMPLWLLKGEVWQSFLVPTLEGQYIIKNILLIALAIGIAAHLRIKR